MGVNLTQEDLNELKRKGYSDTQIQQALLEIEEEDLKGSYNKTQQSKFNDPRSNSRLSSFSSIENENLVKFQLQLDDILERIEHILRGDIPKFKDGHIIWTDNPHPEKNSLNENGVQEFMGILAMYVNRDVIMGDYSNKEINIKVFDFGRRLNNLVFMKDAELGIDTEEKRKGCDMLIGKMVDIVHATYKRALDGAEKRSLREMISISQATSTQLGAGVTVNNQGMPQKERGLLNPMRYITGKYA